MKKIFSIISLLLIFTSCVDVVEVDVPFDGTRLVIEASLDWEKGTLGNEQTIKLSETIPYFDNVSTKIVIGASVIVTNDNDHTIFEFIDQNNGSYTTPNFIPILNQSYTLEVLYNGETYIAKETMISVTNITEVNQSTEKGFDQDAIEVNVLFKDPVDEENFYLIKFHERKDLLPTLHDIYDKFVNGNEVTISYEKIENEDENEKELEPGDIVDIDLYGISEGYFNYIRLLIFQNENSGSPYTATPAPLKGNCVNLSNTDNYAWGYFRLTEVDRTTYIVE